MRDTDPTSEDPFVRSTSPRHPIDRDFTFFHGLFSSSACPRFSTPQFWCFFDFEMRHTLSARHAFDRSLVNHGLFLGPCAGVGVINHVDWCLCLVCFVWGMLQYAQDLKLVLRGAQCTIGFDAVVGAAIGGLGVSLLHSSTRHDP